jgi:hypothetical protein
MGSSEEPSPSVSMIIHTLPPLSRNSRASREFVVSVGVDNLSAPVSLKEIINSHKGQKASARLHSPALKNLIL